jgi:ribonuclease-3
MSVDLDRLLERLSYTFKDPSLIQRALTHRSAGKNHNERFEFLGDSVLGLVITEELFKLFPDATEGELSRMRASLVNGKVLAEIALELELGQYLLLGAGERKSGGKRRTSILSDAVEAIIAAVYLDSGLPDSNRVVKSMFQDRLRTDAFPTQQKDSKTRLQEYLQAAGLALPKYTVTETAGEAHDQTFTVECVVTPLKEPCFGSGKNKRLAEQAAAEKVLTLLEAP